MHFLYICHSDVFCCSSKRSTYMWSIQMHYCQKHSNDMLMILTEIKPPCQWISQQGIKSSSNDLNLRTSKLMDKSRSTAMVRFNSKNFSDFMLSHILFWTAQVTLEFDVLLKQSFKFLFTSIEKWAIDLQQLIKIFHQRAGFGDRRV